MLVVYCIGLAFALVVWCGDFVWFGCVSGVGVVVDLVWWRLVGLGCYVRLVFWFPCLVDWVSDFGGAFMFPWVCQ